LNIFGYGTDDEEINVIATTTIEKKKLDSRNGDFKLSEEDLASIDQEWADQVRT